ncbi:PAS domain-containing protein [Amycolatopsis solani]|uniref:PAS domain-containing protein n=1 Tax=Amycolatopsis solani TaxID=3028615 RepID=UPI0025B15641|nr:PAS domain-containing protein [Amycolatopsis sp. MEP2-6]
MAAEQEGEDAILDRQIGEPRLVRQVFDQMPVLVLGLDGPDMRLAAASAAYRAYAGRSEVIGLPIREVFADLEEQQIMQIFERVYATGEPVDIREMRAENGTELRLLAPRGTTADMVLSLVELDHLTNDPDYPETASSHERFGPDDPPAQDGA